MSDNVFVKCSIAQGLIKPRLWSALMDNYIPATAYTHRHIVDLLRLKKPEKPMVIASSYVSERYPHTLRRSGVVFIPSEKPNAVMPFDVMHIGFLYETMKTELGPNKARDFMWENFVFKNVGLMLKKYKTIRYAVDAYYDVMRMYKNSYMRFLKERMGIADVKRAMKSPYENGKVVFIGPRIDIYTEVVFEGNLKLEKTALFGFSNHELNLVEKHTGKKWKNYETVQTAIEAIK